MSHRTLLKSVLRLIDITATEAMDWVLEDSGCYPAMSAHSKKRLRRQCLAGWRSQAAEQGAVVAPALCVQKDGGLCETSLKNSHEQKIDVRKSHDEQKSRAANQ